MSAPLVGVGALSAAFAGWGLLFQRTHSYQRTQALRKLSKSFQPPPVQGVYMNRPTAEKEIEEYLSSHPSEGYVVATSPKGSGKSTVLNHVLRGRVGVLLVRITPADVDMIKAIVRALNVNPDFLEGSEHDFVLELCRAFKEQHSSYPVIVLDMEGDYAPDWVAAAAKALGHMQKFLTSDNAAAHSISDISAMAVASCVVADPRASFVYVPELSHVDARVMLESFIATAAARSIDISNLVSRVGGNPAVLKRLWRSPARLETEEMTARVEVNRLVTIHPSHKIALFELAKRPFHEGMKQIDFEKLAKGTLDYSGKISEQYNRVIHINLQNLHVVFHKFTSFRMTQELMRDENVTVES